MAAAQGGERGYRARGPMTLMYVMQWLPGKAAQSVWLGRGSTMELGLPQYAAPRGHQTCDIFLDMPTFRYSDEEV